jgi:hypothetical protein
MGTELPTKVMLGQTLVLMQMTFLNNVREVGRLVLSRTSCFFISDIAVHGLHISKDVGYPKASILNSHKFFRENAEEYLTILHKTLLPHPSRPIIHNNLITRRH